MKKVLALLFTLILLGSVSVTAFAVDSPGGELLYKVEVTSKTKGGLVSQITITEN